MYQITDAVMCENRELNLLMSIIYYELLVQENVLNSVYLYSVFLSFVIFIYVIIMKKLVKHGSDFIIQKIIKDI